MVLEVSYKKDKLAIKKLKIAFFILLITFIILSIVLVLSRENSFAENISRMKRSTGDEGEEPGWIEGVIQKMLSGFKVLLKNLLGFWMVSLIIQPFALFLAVFTKVVYFLTGSSFIFKQVNEGDGSIFFGFSVNTMFIVITTISVTIFVLFFLINVIRILSISHDSMEGDGLAKKQLFYDFCKALVAFLVTPYILWFIAYAMNGLFVVINGAVSGVNGTDDPAYSISDMIVRAGMNKDHIDIPFSGTGTKRYENISTNSYDMVFMPVILIAVFLVGYFVMGITLVSQLYTMFVIYVTMGFFVATFSSDHGQRYKMAISQFISKLIASFSVILGIQLFMYITPLIQSFLFGVIDNDLMMKAAATVLLLLGGLAFMTGFPTWVGGFFGESVSMGTGLQAIGASSKMTSGAKNLGDKMSAPINSGIKSGMNTYKNSSGARAREAIKDMRRNDKYNNALDKQINKMNNKTIRKNFKSNLRKDLD